MDDFGATYAEPCLTKLGNIIDITADSVGWASSWCVNDEDDDGQSCDD
ncbi:MAG: hypothetical protein M1309_05615 [Actinobacteria bacterium]|nr:hypothetical protein [Actinomycetota bacterium]